MAIESSELGILVKMDNKTGPGFQKLNESVGSMSKSVFAGVASWDILKNAVLKSVDFFKSSVAASVKANAEMAMVRNNVANAGFAYDQIGPKLEEYSKKMIQMGFDDESTATSVSKLMLVTKDYEKAITLNSLAMDVARYRSIDLESASAMVRMATVGNVKALRDLGIETDKNTTASERLKLIQDKVTGSAEAYSKTLEGKLQTMQVGFTSFKEKLGDVFGPALSIALSNFNTFLSTSDSNATTAFDSIAKKMAVIVNPDSWKLLGTTLKGGWDMLVQGTKNVLGFGYMNKAQKEYQDQMTSTKNEIIELTKKIDLTTNAAMKLQNFTAQKLPADNLFAGIGSSAKDAADKSKKALETIIGKLKDFKTSIDDIKKSEKEESEQFIKSQLDKSMTYKERLAEMVAEHKDKWQQAKQELLDLPIVTESSDQTLIKKKDELLKTVESEYKIISPYLNDTSLTALSGRSDIEKLTEDFKRQQAEDTVDTAKKMQELQTNAQTIYINFNNSTITDEDIIDKIKKSILRQSDLIYQGAK